MCNHTFSFILWGKSWVLWPLSWTELSTPYNSLNVLCGAFLREAEKRKFERNHFHSWRRMSHQHKILSSHSGLTMILPALVAYISARTTSDRLFSRRATSYLIIVLRLIYLNLLKVLIFQSTRNKQWIRVELINNSKMFLFYEKSKSLMQWMRVITDLLDELLF